MPICKYVDQATPPRKFEKNHRLVTKSAPSRSSAVETSALWVSSVPFSLMYVRSINFTDSPLMS